MNRATTPRSKPGGYPGPRWTLPFEKGSFEAWITPANELDLSDAPGRGSVLAALQAGFVRVSYQKRRLNFETIRWDNALKTLTSELMLQNAEQVDVAHCVRRDANGEDVQMGCASLQVRREHRMPINRRSLASWNDFKAVPG